MRPRRGKRRCLALYHSDHLQQLCTTDKLNRFTLCEALSIFGVAADANDLHRVGLVVDKQAGHFAHDADPGLLAPPLLALHQCAAAVPAQDQVDAAIGAAQAGFLHGVALAAEGFAYQQFELAPAALAEAFQIGAGVE